MVSYQIKEIKDWEHSQEIMEALINDNYPKDKNNKVRYAFRYWKRFNLFSQVKPLVFYENKQIVGLVFFLFMKKGNCIKLEEIVSYKKGYGTIMLDFIKKIGYNKGNKFIYFISNYKVIDFYIKKHFYFWGIRGDGFLVYQPIILEEQEQKQWLEEFKQNPYPFNEYNKNLLEEYVFDKPLKLKEIIPEIKQKLCEQNLYYLCRKKGTNMKVINLVGSNGIGKSTRMSYLVYYLEKKYGEPEIVYGEKDGKKVIVGRIYNNEIFIFGKVSQKGVWISLDTAAITTLTGRYAHIVDMLEKGIKYYFLEGYFNNNSYSFFEKLIRNPNLETHYYMFMYKTPEEFLERCNNRTGKTSRDLEWTKDAPGFKKNEEIQKLAKKINQSEGNFKAYELDKNAPKDLLIRDFFGEKLEIDENEVKEYLKKTGNYEKQASKSLW